MTFFEKPDLLLKLKLHCDLSWSCLYDRHVSCFEKKKVIFKGAVLPDGLNVKRGRSGFICTYLVQWIVVLCWFLTVNLSLKQLREAFFFFPLQLVAKERTDAGSHFMSVTWLKQTFVCCELMTAFIVCYSTKCLKRWTKCTLYNVLIKVFIA